MNEFNKVLLYSLYLSLFISLLRFPILANCTALTHTHTVSHSLAFNCNITSVISCPLTEEGLFPFSLQVPFI